jgi:hypothetical protein
MTMRHLQLGSWLIVMLLLAACSKDKAIDEPAKLTPFAATLRVEHLWGASVDNSKAVPCAWGRPWRWSTTASTPPGTRATWWPSI